MRKRERREIRRQNRQQAEKEYLRWRNIYVGLSLWTFIFLLYGLSKPSAYRFLFLVSSVITMVAMAYTTVKFIKCREKLENGY
jgi:hypothetical protein